MQVTIEELVLNSALFRDTSIAAVREAFACGARRQLVSGEQLLSPGQPNHALHLLLTGELQVLIGSGDASTRVPISPGQCVGEMSVIDGHQVSAPVLAATDCELLSIGVDSLWALTARYPLIARNLLALMAGRVRITNQSLTESLVRAETRAQDALTDALTGTFNRRWLEEMLPRHLQRAQVSGRPFALAMLDIDHFKRYNDSWGHAGGDAALRATAGLLRKQLRPTDQLARYGGEEFCLLLPETSLEHACLVAERLVRAAGAHPVTGEDGASLPSITFSLGLALHGAGQTAEQLLKAADAALYRAKQAGRNRYQT